MITPFQPMKLLFHRNKVEAALAGDFVYPVSVEFDLSNVCNHDCPFCSFGTSQSQGYRQQNWQVFPFDRAMSLLKELRDCGVESITFTGGGEPLMHKQAPEIFGHATALGLQWGLVTNGQLLTEKRAGAVAAGATFCRVSLDAGSDHTHMKTHGARHPQYHEILGNIRNLRKMNGSMTIGVSFCMMEINFREACQAARDVKEAGANYIEMRPAFETEWRGDGWNGVVRDADDAKTEVEYTRMHVQDASFQVIGITERFDNNLGGRPVKKYSQCRVGPLTTVIGADGNLWHCCVQRGQPFFKLASVLEKPFAEVWRDVWQKRDESKIDVSKCPRCRYDGYNELMEQAFLADGMHRSFV